MLLLPALLQINLNNQLKTVNKVMFIGLFTNTGISFWQGLSYGKLNSKLLFWLGFLLLFPLHLFAYPGIYEDRIVFGQSAALTGPNQILGLNYHLGILAAFEEKNQAGGIGGGRSLELMVLDDAYETDLAQRNAEIFASENNVLAVIGGVGTPTAKRIVPVLRGAEIPFIGPLTGANFLNDQGYSPNVINIRASYHEELLAHVDHFINDLGFARFGIIYQEDAFGQSVYTDLKQVLEQYDLPILARATFSRNSHAVHGGLFTFAKADLDAIFIIGTYATNSEIINLSHSLGHDYVIANLSFSISKELRSRLDRTSDKIFVTEVVPDPFDEAYPITASYRQALGSQDLAMKIPSFIQNIEISPNEVSLEGYILGRFVISILERMEGNFTREHLMEVALTPGNVDLGGWILDFQEGSNSGTDYIRLTNFND